MTHPDSEHNISERSHYKRKIYRPLCEFRAVSSNATPRHNGGDDIRGAGGLEKIVECESCSVGSVS